MRKIIIIGLFAALCYQAKAQNDEYIPMLGDSIVWHFSCEPWNGAHTISPEKDTTINSLKYKKIRDIVSLVPFTSFIREDTIERRVYLLSIDSLNERILYDFSLEKGYSTYLNGEHNYMHPCWEIAGGSCDSGIVIQEKEKIQEKGIYHNPVTDVSKLDLSQFKDDVAYIQIYNTFGFLEKEIKTNNNTELSIKKSDYKPGFYFLRIQSDYLGGLNNTFF